MREEYYTIQDNMNKRLFILIGIICVGVGTMLAKTTELDETYGNMYQWYSHAAFTNIDEVVIMGDEVYGLSCNSIFSVNKTDREKTYYTKKDGLSGSMIDHIAYNKTLDRMLITYRDGYIDIMEANREVHNITDLYLKQMSTSKKVNDICMHEQYAYLAMSFGIMVVNMQTAEITETYYIGENSSEVELQHITISNNIIYAASHDKIYLANMNDNLMDYAYWQGTATPPAGKIMSIRAFEGELYIVVDYKVYCQDGDSWKIILADATPSFDGLRITNGMLFAMPKYELGVWKVDTENKKLALHFTCCFIYDIEAEDDNIFWLASYKDGLVKLYKTGPEVTNYYEEKNQPEGPSSNDAYRLKFFGDKLYMLPGARWDVEYRRAGDIMIYENDTWTNIRNNELVKKAKDHPIYDLMNVAQDPNDASHYFVTTYGTGMMEMRDTSMVKLHLPSNSYLYPAAADNPDQYTRTDGAMYDEQGNLWILNPGNVKGNVHVISRDGVHSSFNLSDNGRNITLETPGEILVDSRDPQWKWIPSLRKDAGLILLKDNGTPSYHRDDVVKYHRSWVDQNGTNVIPASIRAIAQDKNHTIWVGTSSGIFAIPSTVDFTTSNRCVRVIIPRNDGSGLGDYMLDNEQINTIAVDGANRLWVGTANSGAFLLSPVGDINDSGYTMETVAHFTSHNSLLPTDDVMAIAIKESNGEVFIGTGGGLVSYMSDATEPEESFAEIYAYPNPVRPSYEGYITITGMMGDTQVRIVDGSGNVVIVLESTGGTVAWDGRNAQGERVGSGVYTALCNTKDGKNHGVVKIMVMN